MSDNVTVEYKGVPVPAFLYALSLGEEFDSWALGVDAGILSAQSAEEPPAEPVAYRYFHDGDDAGRRWWRRVPLGEEYSTAERYEELAPDFGWQDGQIPRSIENMLGGQSVEVPTSRVPPAVR